MGTVLAVCTLEGTSGLTDDSAVNNFVFSSGGEDAADMAGNVVQAVTNFWVDNSGPSGLALGEYISPAISRAADAAIIRLYDISTHLAGTPHGSNFYEDTFTLPDVFGASKALPAEVACVVTLRGTGALEAAVEAADGADPGSAPDRPRQRKTGRLFIGPLTVNAQSEESGTLRSRPTTNFINTIFSACDAIPDILTGERFWGVWSRSDAAVREIESVEVDNAWDTQRRRGNAPTLRTSHAFA